MVVEVSNSAPEGLSSLQTVGLEDDTVSERYIFEFCYILF